MGCEKAYEPPLGHLKRGRSRTSSGFISHIPLLSFEPKQRTFTPIASKFKYVLQWLMAHETATRLEGPTRCRIAKYQKDSSHRPQIPFRTAGFGDPKWMGRSKCAFESKRQLLATRWSSNFRGHSGLQKTIKTFSASFRLIFRDFFEANTDEFNSLHWLLLHKRFLIHSFRNTSFPRSPSTSYWSGLLFQTLTAETIHKVTHFTYQMCGLSPTFRYMICLYYYYCIVIYTSYDILVYDQGNDLVTTISLLGAVQPLGIRSLKVLPWILRFRMFALLHFRPSAHK